MNEVRIAVGGSVIAALAVMLMGPGPVLAEQGRERSGGELIWEATSPPGSSLYSVAVNAEGVFVIGNARGGRIEKRNLADGSLIWHREVDAREGMHITADAEAIYAVGSPWRVEKRSASDGSVVWAHPGEGGGKPYGIVVDSEATYASGRNGSSWQIEKWRISDGSVVWRETSVRGVALAVAVDSTGVYLGGYETAGGGDRWRMEKRDLADGSLIWSQSHSRDAAEGKIYGVAVDDTGFYAAGYDYGGEGGQWRIEKRSLEDGALIWQQARNYSNRLDKAHGLTADSTGLYIPGYENGNRWRIERRSLEDGSVIWEALSVSGGRLWYAVDTDDTAVYVGGHVGGNWRIEKRAK